MCHIIRIWISHSYSVSYLTLTFSELGDQVDCIFPFYLTKNLHVCQGIKLHIEICYQELSLSHAKQPRSLLLPSLIFSYCFQLLLGYVHWHIAFHNAVDMQFHYVLQALDPFH